MYTSKKSALQLLALMKAHGISEVVLCPGSRNSPLVHSFVEDGDFVCHSVVDERSAGFYALGIAGYARQPVAVCCTSGSAVLNLAPAVAEAHYQELPLLVITADRPAAWIGQMDGQTLPQPGAFGTLVNRHVQLPEIATPEDEWHCNRLINEAILALDLRRKGPVQINIPLSEPLFDYTCPRLPGERVIRRTQACGTVPASFIRQIDAFDSVMVVPGQLPPGTRLTALLAELAETGRCTVLGEHLCNVDSPGLIGNADPILYASTKERKKRLAPSLLVTLGGHIVSKRLKQFLRENPPESHWHISPSGEVADLFQHLTDIIEANPETVVSELLETLRSPRRQTDACARLWKNLSAGVPSPNISVYSDLAAAGLLLENLPPDSSLHLANSSSVRLAQLFPRPAGVGVYCNRGTSGIEGSLSTATGHARASGKPTYLLIGDLAFFYDMNGIWNPQLGANLHILLNNNGGGEIFHALPGLNRSGALSHIAAPHRTSARAWAESQGFQYLAASNAKELAEAMPRFIAGNGSQPVLLEVFSDMEDNAEQLRTYYHQLKDNDR